jgi:hypothetical protein
MRHRDPDSFAYKSKDAVKTGLLFLAAGILALVIVPPLLTIDNIIYAPWTKKGKALKKLHAAK